jgi:ABC-2 type transport system permease protein
MGPAAYYILDTVSRTTFIVFAVLYPALLGYLFAFFGVRRFKSKDVI